MPLVPVNGNLFDFGQVVVPPALEPRLWFVANQSWLAATGGAFFNAEVRATWRQETGGFHADLWSEPNDPRLWYTMRLDYLEPGQEQEQPGNRARGFFEWHYKIFPGEGGNLGDIIGQQVGLALVYAAPNAPSMPRWNQIHWNTSTGWVYEREWTP
ncbi:hypothetical protein GCM10010915_11740 [Microbacterium faecale]|uniref:Uncharacterized protein n=1 Tax=Microbacterium faecale TaxID=1804630 RepID=A0A917DE65_9MICO|nr:hypothetical protein [Microbacterium faecale]GGD33005.1 hypothetical protein GCM10010915_11740 [Microbacterium faecale]